MNSLDFATIAKLLEEEHLPKAFNAPEQFGPLRWCDEKLRCASRGCSSPTYCKLDGIPRCMMHALRLMNEQLAGYEPNTREVESVSSNTDAATL